MTIDKRKIDFQLELQNRLRNLVAKTIHVKEVQEIFNLFTDFSRFKDVKISVIQRFILSLMIFMLKIWWILNHLFNEEIFFLSI